MTCECSGRCGSGQNRSPARPGKARARRGGIELNSKLHFKIGKEPARTARTEESLHEFFQFLKSANPGKEIAVWIAPGQTRGKGAK